MKEVLFFAGVIVLLTIFFMKNKIHEYLFENLDIYIQKYIIGGIALFLLVILLAYGLLFDNTKEKFSNISQDYENLRPTEDKRPHRYFDVNTEN